MDRKNDAGLRITRSLYGSLIWNIIYGAFQLGLGFYHASFWFFSLAGYYIFLAAMRFSLLQHTRKYQPGENLLKELRKYRACGWVFLAMNLALSLMIFFMVYWNRTFHHHKVTTIALATYTFTAFAKAIIDTVKYRKYNSPVYSAAQAISLAAACVSMLTLESTMLTTFNDGSMDLFTRRIFLSATGATISLFIVAMAVYMIRQSNQKIKTLKTEGI